MLVQTGQAVIVDVQMMVQVQAGVMMDVQKMVQVQAGVMVEVGLRTRLRVRCKGGENCCRSLGTSTPSTCTLYTPLLTLRDRDCREGEGSCRGDWQCQGSLVCSTDKTGIVSEGWRSYIVCLWEQTMSSTISSSEGGTGDSQRLVWRLLGLLF